MLGIILVQSTILKRSRCLIVYHTPKSFELQLKQLILPWRRQIAIILYFL